jgi:hypothetical protein
MPTYILCLGFIFAGFLLCLLGVLLGSFIMFKGRAQAGEKFLTTQSSKGEVFTIPESSGAPNFPGEEEPNEHEKKILDRTLEFLDRFKPEAK